MVENEASRDDADNPWVRNDPMQGTSLRNRPPAEPMGGRLLIAWWVLAVLAGLQVLAVAVLPPLRGAAVDLGLVGTCALLPAFGLSLARFPRFSKVGPNFYDHDEWQQWYPRNRQIDLVITGAVSLFGTHELLGELGVSAAWMGAVPIVLFVLAVTAWVVLRTRDEKRSKTSRQS